MIEAFFVGFTSAEMWESIGKASAGLGAFMVCTFSCYLFCKALGWISDNW